MANQKERSIDEHVASYRSTRPRYEQFTTKLTGLVGELLEAASVRVHTIESRTKSIDSFAGKIVRPGKSYVDPLNELPDLAGLRIILNYEDDVRRVCDLLRGEFDVDEGRSVDKANELAPDQFGYLSVHLVLLLNDHRCRLTEWEDSRGLVAEIQVRTVLQHAWASMSHELQYKKEDQIPSRFRRKLIRLSSLLELADEEFSELRSLQSDQRQEVEERILRKDLGVAVDLTSVREYLARSTIAATLMAVAVVSGLERTEVDYAGQLVSASTLAGITTIGDLDRQLYEVSGKAHVFFARFARDSMKDLGDSAHWCSVLLVAAKAKDYSAAEIASRLGWFEGYVQRALDAAKSTGF